MRLHAAAPKLIVQEHKGDKKKMMSYSLVMCSIAAVYIFGIFSPFSAHSTHLRQSPVLSIPFQWPSTGFQ